MKKLPENKKQEITIEMICFLHHRPLRRFFLLTIKSKCFIEDTSTIHRNPKLEKVNIVCEIYFTGKKKLFQYFISHFSIEIRGEGHRHARLVSKIFKRRIAVY